MSSSFTHGAGAPGRRTVTASAALAAALLLTGGSGRAPAGPGAPAPAPGPALRLPAPTGPHRIGHTTLYLADRARRDPWKPAIPVREVMATVFYPARTVHGYPVAPQMTADAAALFATIDATVHHLPASGVNWAATRTHAHTGAPAQPVRRPVLLYSPGGADPRTLGTGLAEELASHGYVVVTVDHPGDASEVAFPTAMTGRGRVRPTVLRGDPRTSPEIFRTAISTRIADLRFVLDQLTVLAGGGNPDAAGRPLPKDLGRALDLRRVGVYGHSAGGTAAAEAMHEDRRIGAAVNMEGYLDHPPTTPGPGREGELFPVARCGADRPLLLLCTDGFPGRKEMARSWSALLARSRGLARRRRIDHAAHAVFTDYAAMAPQLQAAGLMPRTDRVMLVGALDPAVSVPVVRHHVRRFFDRRLPRC